MSESKVYCITEWYVKCDKCNGKTEVDTYDSGIIECNNCGNAIDYDNRNPENAIQE